MASMDEDEKRCRLCLGDEDGGPLVQPCACRGSAKFIHKACLEKWRRTSPREDAAYRCGQCINRLNRIQRHRERSIDTTELCVYNQKA